MWKSGHAAKCSSHHQGCWAGSRGVELWGPPVFTLWVLIPEPWQVLGCQVLGRGQTLTPRASPEPQERLWTLQQKQAQGFLVVEDAM